MRFKLITTNLYTYDQILNSVYFKNAMFIYFSGNLILKYFYPIMFSFIS